MKKLLTLFFLLMIPVNALAQSQEGFSVYSKNMNGISPAIFLYEAKPGSTIHDTVVVFNQADGPQVFDIYATEGFINSRNTMEYMDKTVEKQYAKWVAIPEGEITIEAQEKKEIDFSITIPEDTNQTTYILGIAAAKKKPASDMEQVTIVSRFVVPIKLIVTDDPQHVPTQDEVIAEQAAEKLRADMEANTLAIAPYQYATLAIFIASFGYLGFTFLRDRKKKKFASKD